VLDPELGRIDRARNERRRMAANKVVDLLYSHFAKLPQDRPDAVTLPFTITSFEFFDSFAGNRSPKQVCPLILIVRVFLDALGISS
jgi:hypothetical protein